VNRPTEPRPLHPQRSLIIAGDGLPCVVMHCRHGATETVVKLDTAGRPSAEDVARIERNHRRYYVCNCAPFPAVDP
jgi:hypothetical protein